MDIEHFNKLKEIGRTKLTQKKLDTTLVDDSENLVFLGNELEIIPAKLILDPYLTAKAKLAYQLIKLHANSLKGSAFRLIKI